MLDHELDEHGIVEWRRGLLVIHSTSHFAKNILPKYFNTRNFKTFRRQLNYYGFVHVRSFATEDHSTTALWVNQALVEKPSSDDIRCILSLRRVEPQEAHRTVEGRRIRKLQATQAIEFDIGVKTEDFKHSVSTSSDDEVDAEKTPVAKTRAVKQLSEEDTAASLLLLLSKSSWSDGPSIVAKDKSVMQLY